MEQQNNTFPEKENESLNTTPSENALQSDNQLRPCDCKDVVDVFKLQEQSLYINDDSIRVVPNHVVLTMGHTEIKIPMRRFKMFAEWYLKPQQKNK